MNKKRNSFYDDVPDVEETKVGDYKAIVPSISGRAWVRGIQQFVLDPDDPFPTGFYLGHKDPEYGGM